MLFKGGTLFLLFTQAVNLNLAFIICCIFQATLCGNVSGKELQTMVSTSELQKTSGTVSCRSSAPVWASGRKESSDRTLFVCFCSVSAQAHGESHHQGLRRWKPGHR